MTRVTAALFGLAFGIALLIGSGSYAPAQNKTDPNKKVDPKDAKKVDPKDAKKPDTTKKPEPPKKEPPKVFSDWPITLAISERVFSALCDMPV